MSLNLFLSFILGALIMQLNVILFRNFFKVLFATTRNYKKIPLLFLLKFPLLYFMGYELLKGGAVSVIGLIAGFNFAILALAFIEIKKQREALIKT